QEGIYDAFVEQFSAAAKTLGGAAGDPFSESTQHGPQVSQTQMDRILGYLDLAKKEARRYTRVVNAMERKDTSSSRPFSLVQNDMRSYREEIFGTCPHR
ncbi:hypothetical protein CPB85DRAFT_1506129, partial [Mucidula mucida]